MSITLSKNQKKIAKELIDSSLQKECAQFLDKIEQFVSNRNNKRPHEAYLELYKKVKSFDKHIAERYDDIKGESYFIVILGLFIDKTLTMEDLSHFDEVIQEKILNAAKLF